jgi:hypothetical protein
MNMNGKTIAVTAAITTVLGLGMSANAGAASQPHPRSAACKAGNPWTEHNMGATGMSWNYVFPSTAKHFRISPCSIILSFGVNKGYSEVLTPNGRVVSKS